MVCDFNGSFDLILMVRPDLYEYSDIGHCFSPLMADAVFCLFHEHNLLMKMQCNFFTPGLFEIIALLLLHKGQKHIVRSGPGKRFP